MELTTPVPLPISGRRVDYNSSIFSIGSCFAENMADKLAYFQFVQTVNPAGILFHPEAIEGWIERALHDQWFTEADVFFHNERWQSYAVHSQLAHRDRDALIEHLNQALSTTKSALKLASHAIITFGTAWVYRHLETDARVANCHKVPQRAFRKELLSVTEVESSIVRLYDGIRSINAQAEIIFTLSPVRHLKDGFTGNQRSKAHLIAGLHAALERLDAHYFPAHEIVMDELRDYRFYASDWLHPSSIAIDYIWEKFALCWIDPGARTVMDEVRAIQNAMAHRPFDPTSASRLKFRAQLNDTIAALTARFPHMKF